MKLAYLILAHAKPLQLRQLVLSLPNSSPIFVHFDAWASAQDWEHAQLFLAPFPNVTFVPRKGCRWGSYGISAATIELISALVSSGEAFDYAALLSGADYPIRSADKVSEYLEKNAGVEHIESFAIDEANRWSSIDGKFSLTCRFNYYHFWLRGRHWPLWRRRELPLGLRIYAGSQWWCLSRNCLDYIHNFCKRNPAFLKYFRNSYIPDEAVIQTIISNSEYSSRISGSDLTFAIWDRPNPPYPAILSLEDLDVMKRSSKLFARKFDESGGFDLFTRIDSDLRD